MRLPSRPNRSKKLIFIAAAILLAVAIAGVGYFISTMDERQRQSVSNGPPSYDQESGDKEAADGTPLHKDETTPTTDPGTTQPPTNTPPAKTTVTPTINSVNNQGGTIVARATITGVSNLKGQCAFIFTKGDLRKEVVTTIGYVNGYYACADGKIPASEFGSGTVKVQVEIRDDQFTGTSAPWELQL